MFDSNYNNNYGGYQQMPQQPGQYMTKQASTLTPEEYKRLTENNNSFSLALTETEVARGICNHRTPDGTRDTLVTESDGTVRCTTCGYTFRPVDDMTQEDIGRASDLLIDILQTIKLLYIDMPVSAQREYFQIIPLIKKIPDLFDIAAKNFSKHENASMWGYRGQNMGTMAMFNTLAGILGGGAPYYAQPQAGYYTGMPQQPYMGQPMYQNMPQQPVYPANQPVGSVPPTNGFGYPNGAPQQPQMGYQPQMTGYQYNPNVAPQQAYQMPAQPQAPTGATAPADASATTDGQNVNVQANFKS